STVAPAGNAKPVPVDPGIACKYSVDAIHNVDVGLPSPVQLHTAIEFFTVSGRAARIGEKHGPSASRVDLKLVEKVEAVHSGRSAMNAEDHWVGFACLPPDRLHEEAVDVPTVCAFKRDAFHVRELKVVPQVRVEMR